jgi:D-aminopeptidase
MGGSVPQAPPAPRGQGGGGPLRARDWGIAPTTLPSGANDAITDVAGVRVGHVTRIEGERMRTGVTAIWPGEGVPYDARVYAGTDVLNGYGVMTGRDAIDEWGLLESPILLTGTPSVGNVYEGAVRHLAAAGVPGLVIPVVAECDDGYLNDAAHCRASPEDALAALEGARSGPVPEGAVGAGTGMALFGYKGGIGTASRVAEVDGSRYTVGVLVQTNFGRPDQLRLLGRAVGRSLLDGPTAPPREGSCIGILATDAPCDPLQLRRLARRVGFGLVRTGSVGNDGSGELFLAFSTAVRVPRAATGPIRADRLVEGQTRPGDGGPGPLTLLFDAAVEAAEAAVLNALVAAPTVAGRDGHVLRAFPVARALDLLGGARP